jgi:hypothetical protein
LGHMTYSSFLRLVTYQNVYFGILFHVVPSSF